MSKAEFEKARDTESTIRYGEEIVQKEKWDTRQGINYIVDSPGPGYEKHIYFKHGADWAYEWCQEHQVNKPLIDDLDKQRIKITTLKLQLDQQAKIIERFKEALEFYKDVTSVIDNQILIQDIPNTAEQALADVEEMENETTNT